MSARARGSRFEREVAAMFGGKRAGYRTQPTEHSDVLDVPYAIECKNSSRDGIYASWIDQARENARKAGKPWLLVVRRKGSPRPTVTLELAVLLEIMDGKGQE